MADIGLIITESLFGNTSSLFRHSGVYILTYQSIRTDQNFVSHFLTLIYTASLNVK